MTSSSEKIPSRLTRAILFDNNQALENKNSSLMKRLDTLETMIQFLLIITSISVFSAVIANQNLSIF